MATKERAVTKLKAAELKDGEVGEFRPDSYVARLDGALYHYGRVLSHVQLFPVAEYAPLCRILSAADAAQVLGSR